MIKILLFSKEQHQNTKFIAMQQIVGMLKKLLLYYDSDLINTFLFTIKCILEIRCTKGLLKLPKCYEVVKKVGQNF